MKKISFILPYFNRKKLTILTLNQFEKLYLNYNIEIIIVDDCSDENNLLDSEIFNYSFEIKLIKLKNKTWINPVIPINQAILNISNDSDIIIFQSPEIFHCNDILNYIINNITDNDYFCFNVFMSPSLNENEVLKNLFENGCNDYMDNFVNKINLNNYIKKYDERVINDWKGWYQHYKYNNRHFHFLTAIKKNSFLKNIGGFCNEMKNGLWYDDDDFISRIKKLYNVKSINDEKLFGIHQWHKSSSHDIHSIKCLELMEVNKKILNYNLKNNIIYCDPNFRDINGKISNSEIIV